MASSAHRDDDLEDVAMEGGSMSPEEARQLEESLRANRWDADGRARLLGYYRRAREPEVRRKRAALISWFIRRDPASPFLDSPVAIVEKRSDPAAHRRLATRWRNLAARTKDTSVLRNAAAFFRHTNRALRVRYLERAERLEPKLPEWKESLGEQWALAAQFHEGTASQRRQSAARAVKYFEAALALTQGAVFRWYRLDAIAQAALLANDLKRASRYARLLLRQAPKFPNDWNYGNAIHNANEVLGQIALRRKRPREAVKRLLAAGDSTGSPQLNTFGPRLHLAKELLDLGETAPIAQYFEKCRKFWSMGRHQLDRWIEDLRAGRVPDLRDRFS